MKIIGASGIEHHWQICHMCGPYVLCGICGNNCCNGGTKELPDGSECGCKEAYAIQAAEWEKLDTPEKQNDFALLVAEYPTLGVNGISKEEALLRKIFGEDKDSAVV